MRGSKPTLGFACILWVLASATGARALPLPSDSHSGLEPPAAESGIEAGNSTGNDAGNDTGNDAGEAYEPAPLLDSPPSATLEPVSKRLFGVIPNHRADQTEDTYTPLTTAEKFHIARSDSFDWPNFFLLAGYAMQSQVAAGGFRHNGGVAGFGKFYSRGLGDQIIGSYVTEAILPSLLHEDPRFFRLGSGTVRHRAFYAASRIFVTRLDNGRTRFNISEIAGNAAVVSITSLYYPRSEALTDGIERYSMQLGNDAISNLLTEFWPDIKHHLRFHRPYFFFPH